MRSDSKGEGKIKWVFKIKRKGMFRASLEACGNSQVPGIVFTKSYAPVIDDASLRIIFIGMMFWNLMPNTIDIKITFLHGDLEERIFMKIPSDKQVGNSKCLVLKNKIYGLVSSVRKINVKIFKALKNCGFTGRLVDPCLWIKQIQ
jgi:hypothetical protein